MAGVLPPANASVLSSIGPTAPELRRVEIHLIHGGALLMRNGVDYVRVRRRCDTHPATSSNGLLLNVTIQPAMAHHVGLRISQPGQVYLPRNLSASSVHVRIGKYLSVDHMLDWVTLLPAEAVRRTPNSIAYTAPVFPHADPNDSEDAPTVAPISEASAPVQLPPSSQVRNAMLVMGSSFITSSWQLARDHVGLKSILFLIGSGMLAAAE